jgi:hypothetical protein
MAIIETQSLSRREREGAPQARKGEDGCLTLTLPVLRASFPLPMGEGL